MKKIYIIAGVATLLFVITLIIFYLPESNTGSLDKSETISKAILPNAEPKGKLQEQKVGNNKIESSNLIEGLNKPAVEVIKKRKLPRVLKPHFSKLKALADSGNIDAAYILGTLLQKCMTLPKTHDELAAKVKQAKEYAIPIKPIENGYKLCRDITNKQVDLAIQYLKFAAESGDMEAQIEYLNVVPPEFLNYTDDVLSSRPSLKRKLDKLNNNKIRFAKSAMDKGSLDAVMYLGFSYLDEVSSTGQDREKALKYVLIANKIQPNHKGLDNLSKNLIAELYEYQVEDVQDEVDQFFKDRSKEQVFYKLK